MGLFIMKCKSNKWCMECISLYAFSIDRNRITLKYPDVFAHNVITKTLERQCKLNKLLSCGVINVSHMFFFFFHLSC